MKDRKTITKIANRIHHALMILHKQRYLESLTRLADLVNQFKELGSESRKLGISLAHNWLSAADQCCIRSRRLLDDIVYSVSRVKQLIEKPCKETPKLSLLVEELNELQQEFGDIDFDRAENTISVVTDPITLEDIYLGPFKIQLELNNLSGLYRYGPYHVIALDPHPAATAEDVTHPHVSNERLCEGDGSVAIRTALEQGRLCDFFTMVRSILQTYNPDSPYVSLSDWDGEPCYECGYTMHSDDTYYCEYCEHDYCSECVTYCSCCDETLSLGCAQKCPHCEENICSYCMAECAECGSPCCKSCLEDNMCPDCEKESEVEENEEQEGSINTEGQNEKQPQTSPTEVELAS